MSTNALAFLLLTRFRDGAPDHEIAKGLDQLREVLKGKRDLGFAGVSLHIVNYACDLLGSSKYYDFVLNIWIFCFLTELLIFKSF